MGVETDQRPRHLQPGPLRRPRSRCSSRSWPRCVSVVIGTTLGIIAGLLRWLGRRGPQPADGHVPGLPDPGLRDRAGRRLPRQGVRALRAPAPADAAGLRDRLLQLALHRAHRARADASPCASASTSRPRAASGAKWPYILRTELLPNLMAPILVYSTLIIPTNILFEAALSFLGVGVPPPTPTWGGMLSDAVDLLHGAALHVLARPGDLRHGAGLQPLRGRAARRVRSQEPVTHRATA